MAVGDAALAGLGDARRSPPRSPPGRRPAPSPCSPVAARRISSRLGGGPGAPSSASARSTSSRLALASASAPRAPPRPAAAARRERRRRRRGAGGSGSRGSASPRLRSSAWTPIDDPPQPVDVVGGDGLARARRRRRRGTRSSASSKASRAARVGLGRVEDAEAGVDPGRDRVGGEQPVAEAVDRRHPGAADRRPAARRRARSRASARRSSSARIRWRSSAAALSVKVKARIASGETPSSQTRRQ